MGDKPKMKMSEGKDKAVKDVLMSLKDFASKMMAKDLDGMCGDETPEVLGMEVEMTATDPMIEGVLETEEQPEDEEGLVESEEESDEYDMPGDEEEGEDEEDLDKLKNILKKLSND